MIGQTPTLNVVANTTATTLLLQSQPEEVGGVATASNKEKIGLHIPISRSEMIKLGALQSTDCNPCLFASTQTIF